MFRCFFKPLAQCIQFFQPALFRICLPESFAVLSLVIQDQTNEKLYMEHHKNSQTLYMEHHKNSQTLYMEHHKNSQTLYMEHHKNSQTLIWNITRTHKNLHIPLYSIEPKGRDPQAAGSITNMQVIFFLLGKKNLG
jgi:hypothetical protein